MAAALRCNGEAVWREKKIGEKKFGAKIDLAKETQFWQKNSVRKKFLLEKNWQVADGSWQVAGGIQ